MIITIAASGTRGDVQPYIALGKGLQTAGYSVRLLSSDDFEKLVTDAGLTFMSVGRSVVAELQSQQWRDTLDKGNFVTILARMKQETERMAHEALQKLPALCEGSDLIIAGVNGLTGVFSVAEKLNIPLLQAYLIPMTPTSAFSSPIAPVLPLGGLYNRLSFHLLQQMLWQTFRVGDVITRRELGLPPTSWWGPFKALARKQAPIIYGYSRHVLPIPTDWPDTTHVTGYWFLDPPSEWTPPPDLIDFLNAGTPPIYIGFGSMGSRNPEEMTRLAVRALELSGQRGLLASGWGGLSEIALPATVHMISSVLHTWLFPKMAGVVHHGGAGTTAAGLQAGVPSIIIPQAADQPYWGQRVHTLGVGTAPISRRKLTAESLSRAISQAVSDKAMQERAAALGEKIRAERGIEEAVTVIDQLLRRKR